MSMHMKIQTRIYARMCTHSFPFTRRNKSRSLALTLSTLTRLFPTCVIMSFSDPLPDAADAAT